MVFIGKKLVAGNFILYRDKSDATIELKPARLQSPFSGIGAVALCDVTGIQPGESGRSPRIICGPVKWLDASRVKVVFITEDVLLAAPTPAGVRP